MSDAIVRVSALRAPAEEWSLVLSAIGFAPSIEHTREGFAVCVPEAECAAAKRALEEYEIERAIRPPPPPRIERIGELERFAAVVISLAMIAFFAVTGPRDPHSAWFAAGSGDAQRILDGEWWRTVTALCLHADAGHVASNALFGALFLAVVCASFGAGLGPALVLVAGAVGNLANAFFQGAGHDSIGASTAVFAAVGLLGGRAVALRGRTDESGSAGSRGWRGRRRWLPFAAGLALIAMLGTGERSDVSAHLLGFLAGGVIGIPASLVWPRPPGTLVQLTAIVFTLASLMLAWQRALA